MAGEVFPQRQQRGTQWSDMPAMCSGGPVPAVQDPEEPLGKASCFLGHNWERRGFKVLVSAPVFSRAPIEE